MSHFLAQLCFLIPVGGEALYDWVCWRVFGEGKDKPWSTYIVRPILFLVAITLVIQDPIIKTVILDKEWWAVGSVVLADFILFFPLLINLIRGEKWYYVSKTDNKWTYDYWVGKIHAWPRLWLFIWLVLTANCLLYWYELKYMFY
jgi:hypothetical protein